MTTTATRLLERARERLANANPKNKPPDILVEVDSTELSEIVNATTDVLDGEAEKARDAFANGLLQAPGRVLYVRADHVALLAGMALHGS